jgi:hypothetical protein
VRASTRLRSTRDADAFRCAGCLARQQHFQSASVSRRPWRWGLCLSECLRDLAGEAPRMWSECISRSFAVVSSIVVALVPTGCWGGGASHRQTRQPISTTVGGMKLVPVARVKGICRQAAGRVGFPIACPAVLPRGSHPFWATGFGRGECDPGSCGPVRFPRWTWVGTYFPTDHGLAHVVVASVPHEVDLHRFVYLIGTITPHRSRRVVVAARTAVRGHAAAYVHPSLDWTRLLASGASSSWAKRFSSGMSPAAPTLSVYRDATVPGLSRRRSRARSTSSKRRAPDPGRWRDRALAMK